ncbi:uncharacterized protein EV154DRAFT_426263 [Mucor mucedo]|uniref:uncharacterized protein n=1 Tax=Mucor mucedo TaxID=29922 RepID=UPI00221F6E46|nr:uncharacterized protein EV154DRAFT_426263 [Mucor mucedo]KAI7888119.1 hypothetical protein EV154DRAFT_426263 [Mucor mucedo]
MDQDSAIHRNSDIPIIEKQRTEQTWFHRQWKEIFYTPKGVRLRHYTIVTWLGRIGFIAKGILYAVMGGLCIATAQHLTGDITGTESPMGVFIFLGLFSIGTPILVIMLIGILFYSLWRFWEGFSGQGYDALCSPFGNFFRARLSPIVSGCVYIVYLVYIGKLLTQSHEERIQSAKGSTGCFPSCWASSDQWVYRMAVGVFGVAFIIAFITQAQNGFSNRWHIDLKTEESTKIEKYMMYALGHLGFLARAGVFMFVAVFMFRTLQYPAIVSDRDAFSDAINQVISIHGGFIGLWFLGIGLILFGTFAVLNAYYKYFPTPPPSRNYVYDQNLPHVTPSSSIV